MFNVGGFSLRYWIVAGIMMTPVAILLYGGLLAKVTAPDEEVRAQPTWMQEIVTAAWNDSVKWRDRSCGPGCVEFNSMTVPDLSYDGLGACELDNSEHPEVCSAPSPVDARVVCITDLEVWNAAGQKNPRSSERRLRADPVSGHYRLERKDIGAKAGEHCSIFLSWPSTGSSSSIFTSLEELLPAGP